MNTRTQRMVKLVLLIALALATGPMAMAQAGAGPAEGFVWSETVGWINFAPTHGGVTVSATHLSGFAWSENVGWIKMGSDGGGPYANTSAGDWGVNRDASGNLSGFAWAETVGWINFDSSDGQVAIAPGTGNFEGYAWSENLGWIHFRNAASGYGARLLVALIDVPTLGSWGLAALALLLAGLALIKVRSRGGGSCFG